MVRIYGVRPAQGYNLAALREQMRNVYGALDVNEVGPDGLAVYFDGTAPIDAAAWQGILDNHNPAILSTAQAVAQLLEDAAMAAASIPGWATWTEAEVLGYIDGNVTDLASAKAVLRAMARMLVAVRNRLWPELQRR